MSLQKNDGAALGCTNGIRVGMDNGRQVGRRVGLGVGGTTGGGGFDGGWSPWNVNPKLFTRLSQLWVSILATCSATAGLLDCDESQYCCSGLAVGTNTISK